MSNLYIWPWSGSGEVFYKSVDLWQFNIHDELILVLDCGEATSVSSLILDLSAIFDTVDHCVLFNLLLYSSVLWNLLKPDIILISPQWFLLLIICSCSGNWVIFGHPIFHFLIFFNFLQEAYSVTVSYFGEQARTVPPNTFYSVFLRFIRAFKVCTLDETFSNKYKQFHFTVKTVLAAVKALIGLTYVFAKGRSDRVWDQLTLSNSLE